MYRAIESAFVPGIIAATGAAAAEYLIVLEVLKMWMVIGEMSMQVTRIILIKTVFFVTMTVVGIAIDKFSDH